MITKQFLTERMGLCNELYGMYCNKKVLMENADAKHKYIKLSRLPDDVQNRCMTSYITFRKCSVPRLLNNFSKENRSEYIFDENDVLLHKINYNSNGRTDCFYIYNEDSRLRLTFRDNMLIEILCNCYCKMRLTEIFTAHFNPFGKVRSISGEIYRNTGNKISRAENYYDFLPDMPMLLTEEFMDRKITLNPRTVSFSFDYSGNKKLPEFFYEYADGKSIDKFILW